MLTEVTCFYFLAFSKVKPNKLWYSRISAGLKNCSLLVTFVMKAESGGWAGAEYENLDEPSQLGAVFCIHIFKISYCRADFKSFGRF